MMVSLIFVTINLVVDILYTVVDPRLRSTIAGRPEQDAMTDAVRPTQPPRRAATRAGTAGEARARQRHPGELPSLRR